MRKNYIRAKYFSFFVSTFRFIVCHGHHCWSRREALDTSQKITKSIPLYCLYIPVREYVGQAPNELLETNEGKQTAVVDTAYYLGFLIYTYS